VLQKDVQWVKDRRESVRVREFRKRYFEIRISLFRLLKTAVPPTVRAVLRLRSAVCVIVLGSSSSGEVVLVFWHASVQAYKIILLYTQIGEEMILPRIFVIGNESSGISFFRPLDHTWRQRFYQRIPDESAEETFTTLVENERKSNEKRAKALKTVRKSNDKRAKDLATLLPTKDRNLRSRGAKPTHKGGGPIKQPGGGFRGN